MNSLVKKQIELYRKQYVELPFMKLVSGYYQIELHIIEDTLTLVKHFFEMNGFECVDNLCTKDELHIRLIHDFIKNSRTLKITIYPVLSPLPSMTHEDIINHFGLIRKVLLEIPKEIAFDISELMKIIQTQITGAYNALETAFESNSTYLSQEIFKNLQSLLRIQLKDSNKLHLVNRYTFTIFNEQEGFLFFDQPLMHDIINHFKEHQDDVLSPIELTIWLLTQPLPFAKSLSVQSFQEGKVLYQPWSKAKYIKDSYEFFQATSKFHGFDEYGIYPICHRRGYFLSIGFGKGIGDEFIPEIDNVKGLLEQQFSEGIKNFSIYIKAVDTISKSIKESSFSTFLGEVIGTALYRYLSYPG